MTPATIAPSLPVTKPATPPSPTPISTSRAGRRITTLNGRQKAAILVRLLLAEGADLKLSALPDRLQAELTQQLGEMRLVDRETLSEVVSEFVETMEQVGLSFPGGLEGALEALDGQLSPTASSQLKRMALTQAGADPWQRIRTAETTDLIAVLDPESAEVAAVVLSKLPVTRAAELLGSMPGDRARRVAYAVSLTKGIAPEMVQRIGASIAHEINARPQRAFVTEPETRVGAILNSAPAQIREALLEGLNEQDQAFADGVRKSIFTFGNIFDRVEPREVPRVLREVAQDELIKALAAALSSPGTAEEMSADFLLSNMSQRMADTLRDEVESLGKVKAKDAEEAMSTVVKAIRSLADDGEITLISPDEDE